MRGNRVIRFRASQKLQDAIAAAQEAASDPTTSDTVRRLVARGLELGPALPDRERQTVEDCRREMNYLGNNLNQLLRHAYMRDVAQGFDWPALEKIMADLEKVRQRLTRVVQERL